MTIEEKACCLRIVDHYGVENQEGIAIEECAELITALRHKARGRASADDIIDELADVIIMTQQLAIVYGQRKVEDRINDKLQRQLDRIGSEKPQPLSDVLEVVQCKDCIYFYEKCCINFSGVVKTDENGFCHHAKRRDEERK